MRFAKDWRRLGLRYKKLEDVCSYVNERISVHELNLNNYISTENMLADKNGIIEATKLPTVRTTLAFKKNDILISNIRPYFKKIWKADRSGGCSNDVLVIRANETIDSDFLYYVLANDSFFEYNNVNSKGTKMPRGDKIAIMRYDVPEFSLSEQQGLSQILLALDDKIENNKKINHHLVA